MRTFVLASILALAACGANGDGGGNGGGGGDGGGGGGSGSDDPAAVACEHVDVVIAVDNSGSMKEEKDALRDVAFPGFADALIDIAGGIQDFRVGVLDACPDPATFKTRGVGGACDFAGGEPWMDSSSPALVDEFRCVGDVDSAGSACEGDNDDEQPASTVAAALEAGGGMASSGFLRDDALLVVVAITDEDEQPTPGASAQEVFDRLVAIKGGDASKIVFLGIGGATACDDGALGKAKKASKLKEITDLFAAEQRGVFWDLCEGNLEQGFAQALTVIESACEDFGPVL